MFGNTFRGKSVWVSGHTGFKGSWLALWLLRLGAKVHGFSLPPPTDPSLFEQLGLEGAIAHMTGDVRDERTVADSIRRADPDFIFHLAAQPLVRRSYEIPVETFSTNIMGTVHVLEAMRALSKPHVSVIVTSDKCYRNDEAGRPFEEGDPLGGDDPYSASKAACEIVAAAYLRSFFPGARAATARAGNVIGGGDWAADRLIPDCIRALSGGRPIRLRNPGAIRPWQHVLEPLCGYLRLAQVLRASSEETLPGAFNFGPAWDSCQSVLDVVKRVVEFWPGTYEGQPQKNAPAEANLLHLSISKSRNLLGWRPVWNCDDSIWKTVDWYRAPHESPESTRAFSEAQIRDFEIAAAALGMDWTSPA